MFDTTQSNPAMEHVFTIPELRELILLRLGDIDTRTLLLSQRTCTAFAATIKHSIHIQRALWFQTQLPSLKPSSVLPEGIVEINPLLQDCRSLKRGVVPFGAGVRAKAATCWDQPTVYAICRFDRLLAESKGESWRDMVIARKEGRFRVWLWCYEELDWDDVKLEVDGEITAGEMVERALVALGREEGDRKTALGASLRPCRVRRTLVK